MRASTGLDESAFKINSSTWVSSRSCRVYDSVYSNSAIKDHADSSPTSIGMTNRTRREAETHVGISRAGIINSRKTNWNTQKEASDGEKKFAILGAGKSLSYSFNSLGFLGSFEVFSARVAVEIYFPLEIDSCLLSWAVLLLEVLFVSGEAKGKFVKVVNIIVEVSQVESVSPCSSGESSLLSSAN